MVPLEDLKPHPRNYRVHPEDELSHIAESLREHGAYKNIVIARDGTILAGHGVVQAATRLGLKSVPVRRLDLDPNDPRALKIITGDNEIGHLSEIDDRALTEILKEIKGVDTIGLLGTGFDEMMLAALVMVTRPASEIKDMDDAAEWVGMPEYQTDGAPAWRLVVTFTSEEDRKKFFKMVGFKVFRSAAEGTATWQARWPDEARKDTASLVFDRGEKKRLPA